MTAILPAGLLATALCLGAVVAYQALAPVAAIEAPARPDSAPGPLPPAAPPAYRPPAEEQFAIINARPLFDPARQPAMEPEASGEHSLSPPDLTLVGVAIGARNSVALLKKADARAAISARLGQTIDGWQLVRIAPDFVILRAGVTDYTVRLRQAAGLPQPMVNSVSPTAALPPGR
jgi:hypothetical protein